MAGLYEREWPETRRALTAEHRQSIEQEKRGVKRLVRTVSAVMYGLAKRLAPHRRLIFALAWIYFFACLFSIFTRMIHPPVWTFVEMAGAFLVVTLLLAMELTDKIKYRDELELARDLQSNLIPKHPPVTEQYRIAAFNLIANTVGGDIYDFVPLEDGRMGILFGDASGHGMAAGLVMAVAHAAFRTQLDIDASPPAIVSSLNRILCRTGGTRSFFSCCYVLLEKDGSFSATVAGHPPLLRIGRDGKVVERIGRGAYPLGIKLGPQWEAIEGKLLEGESLLLHSDGLTEARNANDREFGDSYLEAIVGWAPGAPATQVVGSLVDEWRLFTGGKPADDDVSIAVIDFLGSGDR
jgi:sigma-B regulation protein RsbU (phosphoserine phosphatase)